jgi:MFS family permease
LTDSAETAKYNTLIGSASVVGGPFGAIIGGFLIKSGRRRYLLPINLVAACAVVSTMFLNIYAICFGRFFLGMCGAINGVIAPRMLEETIPINHLGVYGIF